MNEHKHLEVIDLRPKVCVRCGKYLEHNTPYSFLVGPGDHRYNCNVILGICECGMIWSYHFGIN